MSRPLPSFPVPDAGVGGGSLPVVIEQLTTLARGALATWTRSQERRRMRVFGFRPAMEPGVLKREWHGLRIRVKDGMLIAAKPNVGTVSFASEDGVLRFDGAPFKATERALEIAASLVGLIEAYERWIEAREGRAGRLARGGPTVDARPYNALAQTRRLRRMMASTPRRPAKGP